MSLRFPFFKKSIRIILGAGGLFFLPTCTFKTIPASQKTAEISGPEAWQAVQQGGNRRISTGWLGEFKDKRMTQLVNESLAYNQNLKAAAYRLRAAKQGTIIDRAARLPSLNASTSYSRRESKRFDASDSFGLSLNASWETDLWGRLRDVESASRADYAGNIADFRAARLSLAANTAKAWCNLITAEQQENLAEVTLESYKKALVVVERRYKANTLRAVDVQFGRNNVANAERSLRSRRLARNEAARSLELLLGRYPAASVRSSTELPTMSGEIPVGIPAGLLARRPDLQAARADLFASAKRADAAKKNLLPNLRLTGSAGSGDSGFRRVFDPNFLVYSIASSLSQSVYQGGAPTAAARAAYERNKAAIEDYARLALQAFREVESTLDADKSLGEQEFFLRQEVEQTTLAEKRAISDITLGIDGASFLEYLEAQRRAETARASLIRLKNDRLQNRIDLHLALGGDFFTEAER